MKTRNENRKSIRFAGLAGMAAVVVCSLTIPAAHAERMFYVMLATSPKQFAENDGNPPDGFPSRQAIDDQYFDDTPGNDIGSFAEYWEEISYGDVTIGGIVSDWLSMPWAFRNDRAADFYDIDEDLDYTYGQGEVVRPFQKVIIDLDGDPQNADNGPFEVANGSLDETSAGDWIWRPGERFIDMDEDERWDGLDETNNTMDFFNNSTGARVPDYIPDNRGAWTDLNGDSEPENESGCLYLPDSDNDGNPDCCPSGPCVLCTPVSGPNICDCPATQWEVDFEGQNEDFIDCNGNLIPDVCDIECGSPAVDISGCRATGWLDDPRFSAVSASCGTGAWCTDHRCRDVLPYTVRGSQCSPTIDGIPDECQFDEDEVAALAENPPVWCRQGETPTAEDPDDICTGFADVQCTPLVGVDEPVQRCEYHDSNSDDEPGIVEPFENFLRRWDPCLMDPDVSSDNRFPADSAHWIKVYDPNSTADKLVCVDPAREFYYQASSSQPVTICDPDQPGCDLIPNPLHQPSYIENNYPGDWRAVEEQARGRLLWGSHDESNVLAECDCTNTPCQTAGDCPGGRPGFPAVCSSGFCKCIDEPAIGRSCITGSDCPGSTKCHAQDNVCVVNVVRACPAGFHVQYDPPDDWENVISEYDGQDTLYSTKMRAAPGVSANSARFVGEVVWTPEPWVCEESGEEGLLFPCSSGSYIDRFDKEWRDRYPGPSQLFAGCDDGTRSGSFVPCTAPDWPVSGRTLLMEPFDDTDPEVFDDDDVYHRRFFKANAGGLNGDGTGWYDDCGQADLAAAVVFESGLFSEDEFSFVSACNHPILPDELEDGDDDPGQYYDGWVEHDDVPSSKYHKAGDQRLGEVTSPFNEDIWGHDRGTHNPNNILTPDTLIPAAGPYAQHIHGTAGRDGGNLLMWELLSWRTEPPFNNGVVWESVHGRDRHPYAGPSGGNMGFRDYNLDGLVDQGEVRPAGSENYLVDSNTFTGDHGGTTDYPWHRDRLIEDCIEILDVAIDFDDFVDAGAMNSANYCQGPFRTGRFWDRAPFPEQFAIGDSAADVVIASGILSGIILLPPGAPGSPGSNVADDGFVRWGPAFRPIHNEDGLRDGRYADANLPSGPDAQLSWHLFSHNVVVALRSDDDDPHFETGFAADAYTNGWEHFPDLWDYGAQDDPTNCPMAGFDVQAGDGLIHPSPPFKERSCTEWIHPVDLKTVLTPGVPTVVTLPPAELVRDNSYYYIENETQDAGRERLYIYSAGSGFDEPGSPGSGGMPGQGVLILHEDSCDNPEACPVQQNFPPFTYTIVQADGLDELGASYPSGDQGVCDTVADAGDMWPGSTGNVTFNCDSLPASRWNSGNACTGLEISNIVLDGNGGAMVTMTWMPQDIPGLEFSTPPGGISVELPGGQVIYDVRAMVTDQFGGTELNFYYVKDGDDAVVKANDGNLINLNGPVQKVLPGRIELSVDWDIALVADDGRYRIFAELIPGQGADGTEKDNTEPRAGRNNVGTGALTVQNVNTDGAPGSGRSRFETWMITCIEATGGSQKWEVLSTLTHPTSGAEAGYVTLSDGGHGDFVSNEVTFRLNDTGTSFQVGDTWSFVTTGFTALSATVTIYDGQINEAPTAIIELPAGGSGAPPLDVAFDGSKSFDPNGAALEYVWDFGDRSPSAAGITQEHTYSKAGVFTARLTVTNPALGLFGETTVDINVLNTSPHVEMTATPTSGPDGLKVDFDGSLSDDRPESDPEELVYQWTFGDGASANAAGEAGVMLTTSHTYWVNAADFPCDVEKAYRDETIMNFLTVNNKLDLKDVSCYTATLTVTDPGGESEKDTKTIEVGNYLPRPIITLAPSRGGAPLTVAFNAISSFDPDDEQLWVMWDWGDGTPEEGPYLLTGEPGVTDGRVVHVYKDIGQYTPTARVFDSKGAVSERKHDVTVRKDEGGEGVPTAKFRVRNALPLVVDESFTVDAADSSDDPPGAIRQYRWDWGDGTAEGLGVRETHTYTKAGKYQIELRVFDNDNPPHADLTVKEVDVVEDPAPLPGGNHAPSASFSVNPDEGNIGEVFTFDASSSSDSDGDELSFNWNFGDNATDVGKVVSHTYTAIGAYSVRLTVRDTHGATTMRVRTITVRSSADNQIPMAFIGTGLRSGTAPFWGRFDGTNSYDPDGDDVRLTYEWYIDGVVVGREPTLAYNFTGVGTFEVLLKVSDGQATGTSEPVSVRVTAGTAGGIEPGQGIPGAGTAATGGAGRSGLFCGLGMVTALIGSLLGLFAMMVTRRRFPL